MSFSPEQDSHHQHRKDHLLVELAGKGVTIKKENGEEVKLSRNHFLALLRSDLHKKHHDQTVRVCHEILQPNKKTSISTLQNRNGDVRIRSIREMNKHIMNLPDDAADYSPEVYQAYGTYIGSKIAEAKRQRRCLHRKDILSINDFVLQNLMRELSQKSMQRASLKDVNNLLVVQRMQPAQGIWDWTKRKYQEGKNWAAKKLAPAEYEDVIDKAFKLRAELEEYSKKSGESVEVLKQRLAAGGYPLPSTSTRTFISNWMTGKDVKPTAEEFRNRYPDSLSDPVYQNLLRNPPQGSRATIEEILEEEEERREQEEEETDVQRLMAEEDFEMDNDDDITPEEEERAIEQVIEEWKSENRDILPEELMPDVQIEERYEKEENDPRNRGRGGRRMSRSPLQELQQVMKTEEDDTEKELFQERVYIRNSNFSSSRGQIPGSNGEHEFTSASGIMDAWTGLRRRFAGGETEINVGIPYIVGLIREYLFSAQEDKLRASWTVAQEKLVARMFDKFCKDIKMSELKTADVEPANANPFQEEEEEKSPFEMAPSNPFEKAMIQHTKLLVQYGERVKNIAMREEIEKELFEQIDTIWAPLLKFVETKYGSEFPSEAKWRQILNEHTTLDIDLFHHLMANDKIQARRTDSQLQKNGEQFQKELQEAGYDGEKVGRLWRAHIACMYDVFVLQLEIRKETQRNARELLRRYSTAKQKCLTIAKEFGQVLDAKLSASNRENRTTLEKQKEIALLREEGFLFPAQAGLFEGYGVGLKADLEKRPSNSDFSLVFNTYIEAYESPLPLRQKEEKFRLLVGRLSLESRKTFLSVLRYLCLLRMRDPYLKTLHRGKETSEQLFHEIQGHRGSVEFRLPPETRRDGLRERAFESSSAGACEDNHIFLKPNCRACRRRRRVAYVATRATPFSDSSASYSLPRTEGAHVRTHGHLNRSTHFKNTKYDPQDTKYKHATRASKYILKSNSEFADAQGDGLHYHNTKYDPQDTKYKHATRASKYIMKSKAEFCPSSASARMIPVETRLSQMKPERHVLATRYITDKNVVKALGLQSGKTYVFFAQPDTEFKKTLLRKAGPNEKPKTSHAVAVFRTRIAEVNSRTPSLAPTESNRNPALKSLNNSILYLQKHNLDNNWTWKGIEQEFSNPRDRFLHLHAIDGEEPAYLLIVPLRE